jgi:hypothetical protein
MMSESWTAQNAFFGFLLLVGGIFFLLYVVGKIAEYQNRRDKENE